MVLVVALAFGIACLTPMGDTFLFFSLSFFLSFFLHRAKSLARSVGSLKSVNALINATSLVESAGLVLETCDKYCI